MEVDNGLDGGVYFEVERYVDEVVELKVEVEFYCWNDSSFNKYVKDEFYVRVDDILG